MSYLCYPDTIKLAVNSQPNGYGDIEIVELVDLPCMFFQGTSSSHSNQIDAINSDAHAYLDPSNDEVMERAYRLENLYVVATTYGGREEESWYQIVRVTIGVDKLLCNQIDNIHVYFKKVEAQ